MAKEHDRSRERVSWWLRSEMRLRHVDDAGPVAGAPGRCELHAVGHARGAFAARFAGMLLTVAALFAVMIGARPAEPGAGGSDRQIVNRVGASLGALSLGSFVAGGVIERRTRYHVWLRVEARAITRADVGELLADAQASRGRADAAWRPDQLWLVGAGADSQAHALARAEGLRCFVLQGSKLTELRA